MARRTKEEAQETRNRLIDAAERVFQEKGVAHASLEEIAAAAEVTRGAIYWHFKDKAELFDAMMQRVVLPVDAMLAGADCCEEANPLELLRRATRNCSTSTISPGVRRVNLQKRFVEGPKDWSDWLRQLEAAGEARK